MRHSLPSCLGLVLVLCAAGGARAQEGVVSADDYLPKQNAISVGFHVHTYGVGFDIEYRRRQKWNSRFEAVGTLTLDNFKNKEEAATDIATVFGGSRFVYDKQNWAYVLGFMGGMQYVLVPRSEFSRVEFKGGISLGPLVTLLKPYYVEVFTGRSIGGFAETVQIPYDVKTPQTFFNPRRPINVNDIVGEGDWFQGFGRIRTQTGFRVRADFTLDVSGTSYFVRALNFGLQYDVYGSPLPILASQPNKQNWFGGYLGIVLGNAW